MCTHTLAGETFFLHPSGAAYWVERETLLVADLHLGKATHFRRHGMAVPQYVQDETLDKLSAALLDLHPRRVLILGDLFHSDYNEEYEDFADYVVGFTDVTFELVLGNHDRLTRHQYERIGLRVYDEPYFEGPFCFSHHPLKEDEFDGVHYALAGHVHPAVRMHGRGDHLKVPCFHFGADQGLLPSMGSFTGTHCLQVRREDRVFVLAGSSVLRVA